MLLLNFYLWFEFFVLVWNNHGYRAEGLMPPITPLFWKFQFSLLSEFPMTQCGVDICWNHTITRYNKVQQGLKQLQQAQNYFTKDATEIS